MLYDLFNKNYKDLKEYYKNKYRTDAVKFY